MMKMPMQPNPREGIHQTTECPCVPQHCVKQHLSSGALFAIPAHTPTMARHATAAVWCVKYVFVTQLPTPDTTTGAPGEKEASIRDDANEQKHSGGGGGGGGGGRCGDGDRGWRQG